MRRAAIYAQPSIEEALGLALQEAMFHGCACVGAAAGGIPELVKDGETGRLVEARNAAQLASALKELMEDANQRADWGRRGGDFIRRSGMTVGAMIQRHNELYEGIVR
jgi:glycosyltransferase involved in cell wall biosynthesis